jgi:hypothetical protein
MSKQVYAVLFRVILKQLDYHAAEAASRRMKIHFQGGTLVIYPRLIIKPEPV